MMINWQQHSTLLPSPLTAPCAHAHSSYSLCPQYALDDLKRKCIERYDNWDGLTDMKERERRRNVGTSAKQATTGGQNAHSCVCMNASLRCVPQLLLHTMLPTHLKARAATTVQRTAPSSAPT